MFIITLCLALSLLSPCPVTVSTSVDVDSFHCDDCGADVVLVYDDNGQEWEFNNIDYQSGQTFTLIYNSFTFELYQYSIN